MMRWLKHTVRQQKNHNFCTRDFEFFRSCFRTVPIENIPGDCRKIAAVDSNKHDWD